MRKFFLFFISVILLTSCNDDVLPKPKGYLRLTYPLNRYKKLELARPYSFEVSEFSVIKDEKNNWLKIQYPKLNASVHITYRPIQNNIKELLIESEKLVYEHAVKAEQILSRDIVNAENHVFGSMQEISGNAASQIQFHLTDSTHNFIKGALYFYTKPNYDSILPAVNHIKKDIIRLIETLEWK